MMEDRVMERETARYCSAKSTGPFEGGRRFKVELLSFDMTDVGRARANAILQGTARMKFHLDIPLLAKPQGPSAGTYPL